MTILTFLALATFGISTVHAAANGTYTYDPNNPNALPVTWQDGQGGTNRCGTGSSPTSMCQNAFMNSITDFCIWAPPYSDGHNATIGETERDEVAYCLKDGYGTRLIPDGTLLGVHWVQTPDYVQITGEGDFTKVGIPKGDSGGELDPHGADGNGNPIGGLVFGNSFGGKYIQFQEWTSFMSDTEFCFRACKPGANAAALCQHIYDVMGCGWNMPGNYDSGYFESCLGDTGEPMGVYGGSTFYQGGPATPPAHAAPPSSSCVRVASLTSFTPLPSTVSVSSSVTIVTSGASQFTYLISTAFVSSSTSTSSIASVISQTGTASPKSNAGPKAISSGNAWTAATFTVLVGALVGAVLAL
ncbi:hypothetical protein FRC04_000684 [Tulasnella sp. 424]|nr:hypothetical protein FRC04_000684 [Tulasnella sp. 424]KAG8967707.1 hypothetical protein FRC05_001965 [Tulasnella sp. 425]